MDVKIALEEYGLSENEIKVYLTLIKTGESSVQTLAKNSQLLRTTVYHLLDSLTRKGLIGFVIKESIKYFQASEPRKLIENLDEKKKLMQEIVPELHLMAETIKEKPKVTIFEGLKGIRAVLKDVLEEKKVIYHYGDINSMQKVFSHVFPQYIIERVKKKIPIKIICKKEEVHGELVKNAKREFREFAFVNYEFKSSVFIYADKVIIFNIKKEPYYAVLIENKDFYETQKTMFEMIWKSVKNN